MIRALAALVLFASPIAATPGDPLRTLCSSPTMEYCASWMAYDYTVEISAMGSGWLAMHRLRTTIEVFGSGYEAGSTLTLRGSASSEGWGDDMSVIAWDITGPGLYETGEASGRQIFETPEDYLARYAPSVNDLRSFNFASGSSVAAFCVTERFAAAGQTVCHEPHSVPEPSGLLLLATGMVAVAVGRRRQNAIGRHATGSAVE